MNNTLLKITNVLWVLTTIATAAGTVWSFATGMPALLSIVLLLLTVAFGYASYIGFKKT